MLWGRWDDQPEAEQIEALMAPLLEVAERDGDDPEELAEQVMAGVIADLSAALTSTLQLALPSMAAQHRRFGRKFESRLDWVWGDALDRVYAVLVSCQELGESFNAWHRPAAAEEVDHRFEALVTLHARACMVAGEMHALLRTGHALGATARWRTLHEIAVVASVLGDADDDLSRRYLVHSAAEEYEDALLHEFHRGEADREPWPPDELARLGTVHSAAIEEFGRRFPKAWMWAAPLTSPAPPTFARLQELAGLAHRAPDFRRSSHLLHGGSRGTSFVHIEMDGGPALLAGPSNVGLATPAHGAAISLVQVTMALITRARPYDYGPMVPATGQTLLALTESAGESLLEAAAMLEGLQEDALRAEAGTTVDRLVNNQRRRYRRTKWRIARRTRPLRHTLGRRLNRSSQ